jgi:hypothetical protein
MHDAERVKCVVQDLRRSASRHRERSEHLLAKAIRLLDASHNRIAKSNAHLAGALSAGIKRRIPETAS